MIPGLLPSHLGLEIPLAANNPFTTSPIYPSSSKPVNKVPYLTQMFSYGVPVRAPGDSRRMFSVLNTLFNSPLPEGLRKEREKEEKRIAGMPFMSSTDRLLLSRRRRNREKRKLTHLKRTVKVIMLLRFSTS